MANEEEVEFSKAISLRSQLSVRQVEFLMQHLPEKEEKEMQGADRSARAWNRYVQMVLSLQTMAYQYEQGRVPQGKYPVRIEAGSYRTVGQMLEKMSETFWSKKNLEKRRIQQVIPHGKPTVVESERPQSVQKNGPFQLSTGVNSQQETGEVGPSLERSNLIGQTSGRQNEVSLPLVIEVPTKSEKLVQKIETQLTIDKEDEQRGVKACNDDSKSEINPVLQEKLHKQAQVTLQLVELICQKKYSTSTVRNSA